MFNTAELAILQRAVGLYSLNADQGGYGTEAVRRLRIKLIYSSHIGEKVAFTYGDRRMTGTLEDFRDSDDGVSYARIVSRGFLYLVDLDDLLGLA
jgi:hypothetical protein